jgi:peptide/nickel transport system permease protein
VSRAVLAQGARRSGVLLLSLAVASVLVFLLCAVLPGDPARVLLGVRGTPASVAALRHTLGVDRPLVVQYLDWAGGLLRGDFGTSYVSKVDVGQQIIQRLGVTLSLVLLATVLAMLIAVPLGAAAALRHRRASGVVISVLSQLGIAVPAFWAGILISFVFAVKLRWLPANGYVPLAEDPVQWLRHLVLPVVALAVVQGAVLMRYVRSAVLEVMREDFMRTARAIGMTTGQALRRHGWRNAAIPVVTVLGLQLATLLVGAIIVESVFTLPGLGQMLLGAVADRDLLLVQGTVMVLVAAVLVVNYLVDLSYLVLDPRLRQA